MTATLSTESSTPRLVSATPFDPTAKDPYPKGLPATRSAHIEQLLAKLRPILGDVEKILGGYEQFCYLCDTLFVSSPFSILDLTGKRSPPERRNERAWYVTEVFQYEELSALRDGVSRGMERSTSLERALAAVIQRLREGDCWPSRLQIEPDWETFVVYFGDDRVFRTQPMKFIEVPKSLRRRAESTVLGLRKFDDPDAEFLKRGQRWPGLRDAVLRRSGPPLKDELNERWVRRRYRPFAAALTHLPATKEWLWSARKLCELSGVAKPSRSMVQRVAAACMYAPSWNHLAAPGLRWNGGDHGGPWVLYRRENGRCRIDGCYYDGIDAAADLLSRARELTTGWHSVGMSVSRHGSEEKFGIAYGLDDSGGSANYAQVRCVGFDVASGWLDAELEDEVRAALRERSTAKLEALFGIGMRAPERASMAHAVAQELIAQEGRWRFTLRHLRVGSSDREAMNRPSVHLEVRHLDPDGRTSERYTEWTLGAAIVQWQDSYLFCTVFPWEGKLSCDPTVILDGLSAETIEKIRSVLPRHQPTDEAYVGTAPTTDTMWFGTWYAREDFRRAIRRFEQRRARARDAGASMTLSSIDAAC